MKLYRLIFLAILLASSCSRNQKVVTSNFGALTDSEKRLPGNAVAGLKTYLGLETNLFASEPMVVNPTNMDIDARGRVWITEGYNYRIQLHEGQPVKEEGDRIMILEDVDGDGKADRSKVFYQGMDINSALGILVLGNKVIVSCSPNVFVFTDTDGDDKADTKEVLFSGIEGIQHDHGVHAFVFGPDGKLYFNFGNSGTRLLDKDGNPVRDRTGAIVDNSGNPFRQGMVFRCNMDGSDLEVVGHNFRNNYEVAVDSYGTLWQSDNDDDGNRGVRINYVMEYGNYGYTDEMTGAGWRAKRTGMNDSIPLRHWHQNDPGSIPNLLQTGAGSPTGILVYEGELLPKEVHSQIIHADAGPNIVRSYLTKDDGAGYSASIRKIVEGDQDQWFRPSDVCVAPDGSVMIADWYDPGVGGHGVGDLSRGRIFRVAPTNERYSTRRVEFKSPQDMVEALKSPNMATRYLAWEAIDKLGGEGEKYLKTLWNSSNPVYAARALWLLSRIDGSGQSYIDEAFENKDPNIRITAIRAARNLGTDIKPALRKLIQDPSPQVRREIAIALRNDSSKEAEALWVELALQYDGNDRWYLEALGIGSQNKSDNLFSSWLDAVGDSWRDKPGRDIIWRLRTDQTVAKLTELIAEANEPWPDRLRYFRALDFHSEESRNTALVDLIKQDHPEKDKIVVTALSQLSDDFIAKNPQIRTELNQSLVTYAGTIEYLDLVRKFELRPELDKVFSLGIDSAKNRIGIESFKLLLELNEQKLIISKMTPSNSGIIVDLLGKVNSRASVNLLSSVVLENRGDVTVRRRAVTSLGSSRGGLRQLIGIIENGEMPIELESAFIEVFQASGHEDFKSRAANLLNRAEISEGKTFAPISQLVRFNGDSDKGRRIFQSTCISCHQVNGQGIDFGPNLTEIGSKLARSALYMAILDPSEAIGFGYEGVDITMKDGQVVRGYISSDTDDLLELKLMGGLTDRYRKNEIESVMPVEGSLMTNVATAMEQDDLVNLVAYLEQLKRSED